MREILLDSVQYFLLFCCVLTILRLLLGPTASDRLVALNVLSGITLAFLVLLGMRSERSLYLDVALVYDIFGFLGFLALTRFLKDHKEEGQ